MHVVATAGHVDHGKSTLVRALTGMEPDRYEEERRRGLTIDLGFAWTRLAELDGDSGQDGDHSEVAFVDVPGHERFVTTMLAGVGPVPVVLFVVAADGGWMPQSAEHLDALAALGVSRGLLVLTRADVASEAQLATTRAQARAALQATPLAGVPEVVVAAATGAGLDTLRRALAAVLASTPVPSPTAPVRLWVDRVFTIRGAGTVVTGTLPAGTLRVGDDLALPDGTLAGVRGLQTLGRPVAEATGVARVAVNLRGVGASDVHRGQALTHPGTAVAASTLDVRWRRVGDAAPNRPAEQRPVELVLHLGSAAQAVHVRPLGSDVARLTLRTPLPLRLGDVGLLRDPGAHRIVAGVDVLDPAPPPLRRRGAAHERALVLAGVGAVPDARGELRRRGIVTVEELVALGLDAAAVAALATVAGVRRDGLWLVDPDAAASLRTRLTAEVAAFVRDRPLEAGMPLEAARRRLGLPTTGLVTALLTTHDAAQPSTHQTAEPTAYPRDSGAAPGAGLRVSDGRLVPDDAAASGPALPSPVRAAVDAVLADLAPSPYRAPEAERLRELGLGTHELSAAVRAGHLARVADGVYLAPATVRTAGAPLAHLPQPFTVSQAREAWGTSRRVAVPLLELLDRRGLTRRLPDARRTLTGPAT